MWIGRATVFTLGLAVVLAVMLGVTTGALAAVPGDPFKLGRTNVVNKVSTLTGKVTGPMLRIDNAGTGTALDLRVDPGMPPMTVDSDARVTNLNTDKIDGQDSTAFAPVSGFGADEVISAIGPLPLEGIYSSKGGTLLVFASGSGFRSSANARLTGRIGMNIIVDGSFGRAEVFTDERDSHKAFVDDSFVVEGLPAGDHTIRLEAVYSEPFCNTAAERRDFSCTTTDSTDRFNVTVIELPE